MSTDRAAVFTLWFRWFLIGTIAGVILMGFCYEIFIDGPRSEKEIRVCGDDAVPVELDDKIVCLEIERVYQP